MTDFHTVIKAMGVNYNDHVYDEAAAAERRKKQKEKEETERQYWRGVMDKMLKAPAVTLAQLRDECRRTNPKKRFIREHEVPQGTKKARKAIEDEETEQDEHKDDATETLQERASEDDEDDESSDDEDFSGNCDDDEDEEQEDEEQSVRQKTARQEIVRQPAPKQPESPQPEYEIEAVWRLKNGKVFVHWSGFNNMHEMTVEPMSDIFVKVLGEQTPQFLATYPWSTGEDALKIKEEYGFRPLASIKALYKK